GGPGRGGGGFPRRGAAAPVVEIDARPDGLLALAESPDSTLAAPARRLVGALSWPGKPAPPAPPAPELTAEERQRVAAGAEVYAATCAACHQANGEGLEGVARSLVGSPWALSPAPQIIRIVLHGKEGAMLMPGVGRTMDDEQVAAVLTYVRHSWGNE